MITKAVTALILFSLTIRRARFQAQWIEKR
jgi:hypothetical protein